MSSALALIELSKISILGVEFNVYALLLVAMLLVLALIVWRAHRDHHINWAYIVTRDGVQVSTTKVLQVVGGVVATWVIVKQTLQGTLTWDIFMIYLAYVASVDGFSRLLLAKYGAALPAGKSMPSPTELVHETAEAIKTEISNATKPAAPK